MPSIRCTECGHRIVLPTVLALCTNCGTPLPSAKVPATKKPAPSVSTRGELVSSPQVAEQPVIPLVPEREIVDRPGLQPGSERSEEWAEEIPLYPGANDLDSHLKPENDEEWSEQSPQASKIIDEEDDLEENFAEDLQYPLEVISQDQQPQQTKLALYNNNLLRTPATTSPQNMVPLGSQALELSSEDIYSVSPHSTYNSVSPFPDINIVSPVQTGKELQLTDLPRGYPQRPPDIDGLVIQVQTTMEYPLHNFAGAILKQVRDVVWAVPGEEVMRHQEREKVQVTLIRLRGKDGKLRDARLEGYLKGVNISLGDTVSVWGFARKGNLVIRRGYNHTTRGGIVTTTTGATMWGYILLLIALVTMAFLLFRYQGFFGS